MQFGAAPGFMGMKPSGMFSGGKLAWQGRTICIPEESHLWEDISTTPCRDPTVFM
jgi:hypothetical protein